MTATVIDVWAQQPTARFMGAPWLESLLRWTGGDRRPPTLDETVAAMDRGGVEVSLLSAWGTRRGC